MRIAKDWQRTGSLLLALGMTTAATLPTWAVSAAIANPTPYRVAQLFSQPYRVGIPAGTIIPVTYTAAEKIIVTPEETAPVTLTVAQDIRTSSGTVLIRAGSQIEGELQPSEGGTRFVSKELIPAGSDRRFASDATSNVITERETITERSDPNILRGAAIGAAAAAVLSEIFGKIDVIEVLAGAGLGALGEVLLRRDRTVEVIVINPETDLDLQLQSDFVLQ